MFKKSGLLLYRIESKSLVCSRLMGTSQRTAGIIIVGDEILNGSVVDTNSNFLTRKMRSLGVDVRKISVLSDSIEDIAEEIAHFSKKYNYVITSGGIGPTHDDITYQGVAKGLNEPLTLLPGLVELIKNHFKVTVDDFDESNPPTFPFDVDTSSFNPALKMALVPACSQLHFSPAISRFPMVQAKNVFIFPGIHTRDSWEILNHWKIYQVSLWFLLGSWTFWEIFRVCLTFLEGFIGAFRDSLFREFLILSSKFFDFPMNEYLSCSCDVLWCSSPNLFRVL